MRHLISFALAVALFLSGAATAHADGDVDASAAVTEQAIDGPRYFAGGLGVASLGGATGPAMTIELGVGLRSFPIGLHAEFVGALVTSSLPFGADGQGYEGRAGLELHTCGDGMCAYLGADVGEASVMTMSQGFLSDAGFTRSGYVVVPRAAVEIGQGSMRLRATVEVSTGEVSGAAGTIGFGYHW